MRTVTRQRHFARYLTTIYIAYVDEVYPCCLFVDNCASSVSPPRVHARMRTHLNGIFQGIYLPAALIVYGVCTNKPY